MESIIKRLYEIKSPLFLSPYYIQLVFQEWTTTQNYSSVNFDPYFSNRRSLSNKCTKIFKRGDLYYDCSQCSKGTIRGQSLYFCQDCFCHKDHTAHYYVQKKVTGANQNSLCICGKFYEPSEKIFRCQKHISEDIQASLLPEQENKFNQYFVSMYRILIYLANYQPPKDQPQYSEILSFLIHSFHQCLYKLVSSSLQYSQAFLNLILKPTLWAQPSILINLISSPVFMNRDFERILLEVIAYNQTYHALLQNLDRLNSHSREKLKVFRSLFVRLEEELKFPTFEAIEDLIVKNKYIGFCWVPYSNYADQTRNSQVLVRIVQKLDFASSLIFHTLPLIVGGYICYLSQKQQAAFIKYFIQFLRDDKHDLKLLQKFLNQLAEPQDYEQVAAKKDKFVEKTVLDPRRKIKFIQFTTEILILRMFVLLNGLSICPLDIKSKLTQLDINYQLVQDIMLKQFSKMIHTFFRFINLKLKNKTILYFAVASSSYRDHMKNLWKSTSDNLWQAIFHITDEYVFRWQIVELFKDSHMRSQFLLKQNIDKQDLIIHLQQMQKQYLYECQHLCESEIQLLGKLIGTEKFGSILESHCQYSHSKKLFIYNSSRQYPNKTIRLLKKVLCPKQHYPMTKFAFNEEQQCLTKLKEMGKQNKTIIERMIIDGGLLQQMMDRKKMMIRDLNDDESKIEKFRENKVMENFLQILVLINNLCQGWFDQLSKYLHSLRTSEVELSELYLLGDKTTINHILSIQEETNKWNISPEKGREFQHFQQKAQGKRVRRIKEIKEKRERFLEELIKGAEASQESEECCIICHENGLPKNELVYMINITDTSKSNSFKSIAFENCKSANIFLSSCFHPLHLECFFEIKGSDIKIKCPLCKSDQNSIFPINSTQSNWRLNNICENVMKESMIRTYKNYEVENWFRIFLEFLIESKIFYLLINPEQQAIKRQKIKRLSRFVEWSLINLYENASQPKKTFFDESIDHLKEKILECEDKDFQIIQILVLQVIEAKIKGTINQIKTEELTKLSQRIDQQDFQILKRSLEDLAPLQQIQSSRQRQKQTRKITFDVKKLPSNWNEIPRFGSESCDSCGSIMKSLVCLICGDTLCQQCYLQTKHKKKHKAKVFSFVFDEGKLHTSEFQKQNNWYLNGIQPIDLYYNEMRIPLRHCKEKQIMKTMFRLDDAIFNEFKERLFQS